MVAIVKDEPERRACESVSGGNHFVQVVVGLDQRICRIPAVHAPQALHPHEALSSLKVKKLIFYHQALASFAFHVMVPPRMRHTLAVQSLPPAYVKGRPEGVSSEEVGER